MNHLLMLFFDLVIIWAFYSGTKAENKGDRIVSYMGITIFICFAIMNIGGIFGI